VHKEPPEDMYFKGALMLHTLRSVIDDDRKWRALLRDTFQRFKYRNILTEDLVTFFDQRTGMNLAPIFDQYLRHAAIPTLELRFDGAARVSYRWKADEAAFAMPIKVGDPARWQVIRPTGEWQTMPIRLAPAQFQVATDLYYVNVTRLPATP
jgi:aminopeptidase N